MNTTAVTYHLGRPVVDLLAGLLLDLDIDYHAPLPVGPKIFAPNHPTTTDPFLMLKVSDEQTSILIEETLFKVPVFGDYLHQAGHIPVIPGRGREAYDTAAARLRAGENIAIFPEGQISPLSGGMHRARTGAARLALLTGAPIIPIGIALNRARIRLIETLVKGQIAVGTWYLGGPYTMTVGSPLTLTGDVRDRPYVRAVSAQLLDRIGDLAYLSNARLRRNMRRKELLAALGVSRWAING